MLKRFCLLSVVSIAGVLLPVFSSQAVRATGSISGIVIDAVTGTPVGATTIMRASAQPVVTDNAGRFTIEGVGEGSVTLNFVANRYLARELRYTVAAGEALKDQVVRLKLPGVIHGRVFNANGTPAVGVTVGRLRFIEGKATGPFLEGEDLPELYASSTVKTNDLGEYRFFGVGPGRYQISFAGEEAPAAESATAAFPSFIYPDADRVAAGEVIELVGGEDVRLKDVTPAGRRYGAVRLRLVNSGDAKEVELSFRFNQFATSLNPFITTSDGSPLVGIVAIHGHKETLRLQAGTEALRTFWPNEPGTYVIRATWKNAEGIIETASKSIGFGGTGIDVELQLKAAAPNAGHLTVEVVREVPGGGSEPVSGVNVAINSAASGPPPKSGTRTGDDGKYRLEGIPTGHYAIYGLYGLPEGLYFTGVKHGQNDALKDGFVVSEGDDNTLKAFAEAGAGLLRGTVMDGSMTAVQDISVVMVPDSPSLAQKLSGVLSQRTDQKGEFEIRGIPPRSYRVYAWLHAAPRSHLSPKFMEPFLGKGTAIQIRKGDSVTTSLKVLDEKPK
jgi:protocatechuate 3,4-dioxygenase beta subunit